MNKWAANSLLVCASLAVALLLAMGADNVLGKLERDPLRTAGLLFPPNVSALYEAYEFSHISEINNLGIRGSDTTVEKRHAKRIVAIGDSGTYGWGVPIEETWVKILEENLRARGHDVEVLNLGCPGFGPRLYARTAEEAVPLLKPDLILLDIHPRDDLRQSGTQANLREDLDTKDTNVLRNALRRLFPNFTARALKERQEREAQLTKLRRGTWNMIRIDTAHKATARKLLKSMTAEKRARFKELDPKIRKALREGKINPFLIRVVFARGTSSRAFVESELDSDETRGRIASMGRSLMRVKAVADAEDADVLAILLPEASHVSPEVQRASWELGRPVREDDLTTLAHEVAVRQALHRAEIESVSVITEFRELARDASLYYPIDSHMNAAGNKAFADMVTPIIEERLFGNETLNR